MSYFHPIHPAKWIRQHWRVFESRNRWVRGSNVLGICSTGHGASLALVSGRHGVRALSLDRFMGQRNAVLLARDEFAAIREKRDAVSAGLHFLLKDRHGKLPPVLVFEERFCEYLAALLHGLPIRPHDIDLVVTSECHFATNRYELGAELRAFFPNARIFRDIEHHAIHRCQAYYASPFQDAAVLTVDACGEPLDRLGGDKLAMTLARANGGRMDIFQEHSYPSSSPGRLYAFFSDYLGFDTGEEGKTMGLSSYGGANIYNELAQHLTLRDDGSFAFLTDIETGNLLQTLNAGRRTPKAGITQLHCDVAAAAQMLNDDILRNAFRALRRNCNSKNICMAGGVALNSVSNERAFAGSGFERIYVFPNAGDIGHSLGCALYGARELLSSPIKPSIETDGLGPPYADHTIECEVRRSGLPYSAPADLAGAVSKLIADGKVVGWFQGGSEFGPRALGHRSILADPRPAAMKDYLNAHVKFRETFRPYAPAVLEHKASEWFAMDAPSPYMLRVVGVLPERREQVAGITHVDGTARVQTVSREENPRFFDMITAFEQITKVPMVLNTSFNVAGRPIVETPRDAVECVLSTKIDALAIGIFLVEKR